MSTVADVARYADPAFHDFVQAHPPDARAELERFLDLDELDQAVVVLFLARYASNLLSLSMKWVNDVPCFAAGCGHPRHLGGCELCECDS